MFNDLWIGIEFCHNTAEHKIMAGFITILVQSTWCDHPLMMTQNLGGEFGGISLRCVWRYEEYAMSVIKDKGQTALTRKLLPEQFWPAYLMQQDYRDELWLWHSLDISLVEHITWSNAVLNPMRDVMLRCYFKAATLIYLALFFEASCCLFLVLETSITEGKKSIGGCFG